MKKRYETYSEVLVCVVPGLEKSVPDRVSSGLVGAEVIEIKSSKTEGIFYVVNY